MRFIAPTLAILALLSAPVAHAAIVYDLPASMIVYGHNILSSSDRAAGSFKSDVHGTPLSQVTWYVRVDGDWANNTPGGLNPLSGTTIDLELYTDVANAPGTLVASLGSLSLNGLHVSEGMRPFTLSGLSTALLPSTYYWIVGSSSNAAAGSIEIGLYRNVDNSLNPVAAPFIAYPSHGAILSTDGGATWSPAAQSGFGFFFAGQVTVPETSSSLPLVGLSSALLGFLALRRRR